jgi:hypothetical protein
LKMTSRGIMGDITGGTEFYENTSYIL